MEMAENDVRDHLITEYFHKGFSCLLLNYEIRISIRQLKRILARNSPGRRLFSSFDDIVAAIEEELDGS